MFPSWMAGEGTENPYRFNNWLRHTWWVTKCALHLVWGCVEKQLYNAIRLRLFSCFRKTPLILANLSVSFLIKNSVGVSPGGKWVRFSSLTNQFSL